MNQSTQIRAASSGSSTGPERGITADALGLVEPITESVIALS